MKDVCHCFAEAVRVVLPDENTASAKQWHTFSGNRYFFNGLIGPMFTRSVLQELDTRRCVKGLVDILEQVPQRAAARGGSFDDDAQIDALVFWTILRWERTFALDTLESLGVDMWALTAAVDELLHATRADAARTERAARTGLGQLEFADAWLAMPPALAALLDAAAESAGALQHGYLGVEHVVLAIFDGANARLTDLLYRHGVTRDKFERAVVERLSAVVPAECVEDETAGSTNGEDARPAGAGWDTPAVGVPRRFGMGPLMVMVTMYAVLFAALKGLAPAFDGLAAPSSLFIIVGVLVSGVGLGQMVLFGGRYPRAASIWVGVFLFPVLLLAVGLAGGDLSPDGMTCIIVVAPFLGALFGYLAGGLSAGVFLVLEYVEKRRAERQSGDDTEPSS